MADPHLQSSTSRPERFALGFAILFLAVNLWSVFQHVMWRDEWYNWLAANHASSFAELHQLRGHQGRPIGWTICTWLVCQLGCFPEVPKVFHALVTAGSVYLLARYSRIPRTHVVLAAFSYFIWYEYGTIMRDYACEILLLMLGCALVTSKRPRPIAFGITLALLFLMQPFGIPIGCVMGGVNLVAMRCGWLEQTEKPQTWRLGVGAAIGLVGLAAAFATMQLPADKELVRLMGNQPDHRPLTTHVFNAIVAISRGMLPIRLQGRWNSQLLDPWPWLQFWISLAVFVAVIPLIRRRPLALVFYVCGNVGLIGALAYLGHYGSGGFSVGIRYPGHFFIVLIITYWLFQHAREVDTPPRSFAWRPLTAWDNQRHAFMHAFMSAILGVQAMAGFMAVVDDQVTPCSGSQEAAEIIRNQVPPNLPVIGDCDYAMEPVAGYLDRPIYIACRQEYSRYFIADKKRRLEPLSPDVLLKRVQHLMDAEKSDVILIVNYPLSLEGNAVHRIGVVTRSMEASESYLIFRIRYQQQ